ncbi:uncharacterized protein PV09_06936 [Verruconis gallopava]|uniref:Uncharacterized protein n=1 Tax=Verruconis gallopava TaxID=253628 RepID=A0A0D2A4Q1_9PEZI|nr:uncharacterized protein PV09_06936 [Verruconis gallopava]KIW01763.1 hypothetical protein PV09_06936 [Verruconis gallopava]
MDRPEMVPPSQQRQSSTPSSFTYPTAASVPLRMVSAPVPSPTQQRPQYFSSFSTSTLPSESSSSSSSAAASTSAFAAAAAAAATAQQQASIGTGQQQQPGYDYVPDRGTAGSTAQETRNYIDNFALVAEAAKRAQMAVLMRDMEGVELG